MTLVWSPDYLGSPGKIVLSNPLTCTNTAKGDNKLYSDAKGVVPSLDLRFAEGKNLNDYMTGQNLITFSRPVGANQSPGTYVDENGIIQLSSVDQPRFDHDPTTGESLGLLVEESRTNELDYSETFSAPLWGNVLAGTGSVPQVTSSAEASPGLTSPTRLVCNLNGGTTSGDISYIQKTFNYTANQTGTIYLKSNTGSNQQVYMRVGITTVIVTVTPTWQRFEAKETSYSGAGNFNVGTRGGSGSDDSIDILIWGAQLEVGSFATSYIPTTGTALTRSADVASISGSDFSSWYNQSEGTVFSETKGKVTSGGGRDVVDISDGSGSGNRILLRDHQFFITNSTVIQVNIGFTDTLNNTKTAAAFTLNDAVIYSDGANEGTDTSLTLPTVDRIHIGSYNGGGEQLCGCIYRLTYFPERLPDATLQAITQ
jgi:hypothetical protein